MAARSAGPTPSGASRSSWSSVCSTARTAPGGPRRRRAAAGHPARRPRPPCRERWRAARAGDRRHRPAGRPPQAAGRSRAPPASGGRARRSPCRGPAAGPRPSPPSAGARPRTRFAGSRTAASGRRRTTRTAAGRSAPARKGSAGADQSVDLQRQPVGGKRRLKHQPPWLGSGTITQTWSAASPPRISSSTSAATWSARPAGRRPPAAPASRRARARRRAADRRTASARAGPARASGRGPGRQLDRSWRRRQPVDRRTDGREGVAAGLVGQRHGHALRPASARSPPAGHRSDPRTRRPAPGRRPRPPGRRPGARRPGPYRGPVGQAQLGEQLEHGGAKRGDLPPPALTAPGRHPALDLVGQAAGRQLVEQPPRPSAKPGKRADGASSCSCTRRIASSSTARRSSEPDRVAWLAAAVEHHLEQVVERPDRAAQHDAGRPLQQLALVDGHVGRVGTIRNGSGPPRPRYGTGRAGARPSRSWRVPKPASGAPTDSRLSPARPVMGWPARGRPVGRVRPR